MKESISKIITINDDNNNLKNACEPVATKQEGEDLAKELFKTLNEEGGAGLAANQIGIYKRVFVVNIKEPLFFINPIITPDEKAGKFVFLETCLSMPGRVARTERWRSITITADNFEGQSVYDISNISQENVMGSTDAFEMATIQHEMDHINGLLMTDRQYRAEPIHITDSYDRNDKITIGKGGKTMIIKYKKFDEYKSHGWVIVDDK